MEDEVKLDDAFRNTPCKQTSCGVAQKDANGVCIFTTLAPTSNTIDAANRLSGAGAALLALALAA